MHEPVGLVAGEVANGRECGGHGARRQHARERGSIRAELPLPGAGLLPQSGKVLGGGYCEAAADLSGDSGHHVLVACTGLGEGERAGPLQQHRELVVVALVQQHRAVSVPRCQGVRFVTVPGVGEGDLQYGGKPVLAPYWDDEPDAAIHRDAVRQALPAAEQFFHNGWQPGQPACGVLTPAFAGEGASYERLRWTDHRFLLPDPVLRLPLPTGVRALGRGRGPGVLHRRG